MGDTFHPRLVNGPFEDPALYVGFRYQRRALIFDLGTIDCLSMRDVHKLSDIFVSHTHIDHFIGFDYWLRCSLSKDEEVNVFGPPGIIDNIRGKLEGYTWNLIQDYPTRIAVTEVDGKQQKTIHFRAVNKFCPEGEAVVPFNGILLDEPSFIVRTTVLDHGIPCLAFSLEEKKRLNVRQERLQAMGLRSGPWLDELKRMLRENAVETTSLEIPLMADGKKRSLTLREWREALILETEGQKIVYVVDTLFSPGNVEQILPLARGADLLYCEAAFSQADEARARERYHLTAPQAGTLARMAQVKRFVPFHFSPRYEAEPGRLLEEALKAFARSSSTESSSSQS